DDEDPVALDVDRVAGIRASREWSLDLAAGAEGRVQRPVLVVPRNGEVRVRIVRVTGDDELVALVRDAVGGVEAAVEVVGPETVAVERRVERAVLVVAGQREVAAGVPRSDDLVALDYDRVGEVLSVAERRRHLAAGAEAR